MRLRKICLLTSLLFIGNTILAQSNITDRLRAIKTKNAILYNMDGYSITSETHDFLDFNESGLGYAYRKYNVKQNEKTSDSSLAFNNFHVETSKKRADTLILSTSYYFIETPLHKVQVISFVTINNNDKIFEKELIGLIYNNQLPKLCYHQEVITDSIDFVGRKLTPLNVCKWMGANNLQCPYNGQVNWSIHKNLRSTKNHVQQQYAITKSKNGGEVNSEEYIDIIFEGVETKAKKIVLTLKRSIGSLAKTGSGKSLDIYYVAVKVRGQYVSCVLSHWNNDIIQPSGLPSLLEEFMTLQ